MDQFTGSGQLLAGNRQTVLKDDPSDPDLLDRHIGEARKKPKTEGDKPWTKTRSYNADMEYRRCGRTGLMVSAVALGGHWKRVVKIIGGNEPRGWMTGQIDRKDFQKNRRDVVTRCIERGINYVDACCREEILAYSKAL